jgi:hypothetical protein
MSRDTTGSGGSKISTAAGTPDITASALTIAGWFRPDAVSSGPRVWSRWGSTGTLHRFLMQMDTGNTLTWVILGSDSAGQTVNGATALTTGVWYHVAGVWVASTRLTVYLNGAQDGNNTSSIKSGLSTSTPVQVLTFASDPDNTAPSNGQHAEVGLWNAALTVDEIMSLAKGTSPAVVRATALQGYWPLWGVANPEPDLSGLANNATPSSATLADHAPVGRPFPGIG